MKSTFQISVQYLRASDAYDAPHRETTISVEAGSATQAKRLARMRFNGDWRPKNSIIKRVVHTGGSVPACAPAPTPAPEAFAVGYRNELRQGNHRGPFEVLSSFKSRSGRSLRALEMINQNVAIVRTPEQIRASIQPKEVVKYFAVYPTGAQYESNRPIKSSSYGLENIVQVKVTTVNGRVVRKEFV